MPRIPASEPQRTGPATLAILPVKRFGIAKVRLGDELSGGTRRALAEAMVTDVLMALRRTSRVSEVVLVTSEPAAEAIGRGYGANVLVDDREEGQSVATLIGDRVRARGEDPAGAARPRRHARARPRRARRAARPPGDGPLGGRRPRPPRDRDERAPAHAPGCHRAGVRPRQPCEARAGRGGRGRAVHASRRSRRCRSTSTPSRISRSCAWRSRTAAAARRTRAAC